MIIRRFEDIESWKVGRELTQMVYKIAQRGEFKKDYGLRDQICRAAVSITSNIAEGFESHSNLEFICFLKISRRSAAELKSQLYTALDNGYLSEKEFNQLYQKASEVAKLINGFIGYLNQSRTRKR